MKINATISLLLISVSLLWFGCTDETLELEKYGGIEGQVQNSSTGEGIPFASITTNPGTDAILTNQNGNFSIKRIPAGNYTVQVEKEDFKSKSVRVSVKEKRTATAQVLLTNEDADPSSADISADVTNFFNTSRNDSMFVEVDYMVENTGGSDVISNYEVYFKIFTSGSSFFQEISGDSLDSGEQSIGSFTKYIRDFSADSVTISGIYAPDS